MIKVPWEQSQGITLFSRTYPVAAQLRGNAGYHTRCKNRARRRNASCFAFFKGSPLGAACRLGAWTTPVENSPTWAYAFGGTKEEPRRLEFLIYIEIFIYIFLEGLRFGFSNAGSICVVTSEE